MSCATDIHKPITHRAAQAPFHPFSVFLHFRFTGCPWVWWRRGQIGACHVPSSPFSGTLFCLQQGGRRLTGRHQSHWLCHIFFPPPKKKSDGVIWNPACSLESLSHTCSGQQHLSPALVSSWDGCAMPPALQVNIPAGRQPSEHHRHQQNPIPGGALCRCAGS